MVTAKSSTDGAVPSTATVVYVTPDCTDSAVRKRAHGFLGAGVDLISFSFRRTRYNVDYVPDWPNVELGVTTEQRFLTRLFVFANALRLIYKHRAAWRSASVLYARNLDLALLALTGKLITRCNAPFVYEVLDVHPAMTNWGTRGAVLRWLERRVLAQCEMLVVSSPAFLKNYFVNQQKYQGRSFLLENKWTKEQISMLPRKLPCQLDAAEPQWTIGWFGNLRCPRSLEILADLADALPQRVRIYIRGCPSLLGERKLKDAIGQRENMVFGGEYTAPDDLAAVYSNVHFNWCVDLCGGDNSSWLLPNRIYEGGYFGVPAVALADQETGRVVGRREWGLAIPTPLGKHLYDIFSSISGDQYAQMRHHIESQPEASFVDHGELSELLRSVIPDGSTDPTLRTSRECQRECQRDLVGRDC